MAFFFKHVGGGCCFGIAAEKQNKNFLNISNSSQKNIFKSQNTSNESFVQLIVMSLLKRWQKIIVFLLTLSYF